MSCSSPRSAWQLRLLRPRGPVVAAVVGLIAGGCTGQLGDSCRSDDDCGVDLLCSAEQGGGVCVYVGALADTGPHDARQLDSMVDDGQPMVEASMPDGAADAGPTSDATAVDGAPEQGAADGRTLRDGEPDHLGGDGKTRAADAATSDGTR